MKKRDLLLLLLIPIIIFGYSIYGLQQFEVIQSNADSNANVVNDMDNLISKVQSSSPEQTQINLIRYMSNTKNLLIMEQGSEQRYIDFIQSTFRDALICTLLWTATLLVVFYGSNKRRAK